MKKNDKFTIEGMGFDKKGRIIIDGKYLHNSKRTRAKIVNKTFEIKRIT